MIFDTLANLRKYTNIPHLESITTFLNSNDLLSLPAGDREIKGKDLYVKVLRYTPKEEKENHFETHRLYADVQVVVQGVEKMQIVGGNNLENITEYNSKSDYQFFTAQREISDLVVRENEFIFFAPGEAHKPGCRYQNSHEPVVKLVFKTKFK